MARPDASGRLPDCPAQVLTVLAGQMYFGSRVHELRTLLGSCVGLTFWHPVRGLGAMCHFLLPGRNRLPGEPLDARFGDEVFDLLLADIRRCGARPAEFEVHLYGGADTQRSGDLDMFNIGQRNIEQACRLLDRHGFDLAAADVGDHVPRSVSLNLRDGQVRVQRGHEHEKRG